MVKEIFGHCSKCPTKATKEVNHKRWCDKHLTEYLKTPEAQKAVIARFTVNYLD